jgi:FkbM family methyltransferase
LVGAEGHVFAFEPSPRNIASIKKHLAMNHLANFSAVEAAVSNFDGISRFDCSSSAVAGRLSEGGSLATRWQSRIQVTRIVKPISVLHLRLSLLNNLLGTGQKGQI